MLRPEEISSLGSSLKSDSKFEECPHFSQQYLRFFTCSGSESAGEGFGGMMPDLAREEDEAEDTALVRDLQGVVEVLIF